MLARLRALDFFGRSLAHDLRGNLNAIVLHLEMLKIILEPEHAPRLDAIETQLTQLRDRVVALLSLARPAIDDPGPFDLREVVAELAALTASRAAVEQIRLSVELTDHPLVITAQAQTVRYAIAGVVAGCLRLSPTTLSLRLEPTLDGRGRLTLEFDRALSFESKGELTAAWSPANTYGSLIPTTTAAGSRVEIVISPTLAEPNPDA